MIETKNVHETLKKYIFADGMPVVFDVENSHGAYMKDAVSGKEYLDLFSFFATQPIGYNHPKLNTPEFRERLGAAAVHRPSLSDIYTTDYANAVQSFAEIAGRDLFDHYFFIEGGALGVENALKIAFDWKVRKNMDAGRGEKGSQILHFKQAFHGRSGYTLSLTNTADPRKHMYFPKFDWPRVSNPSIQFPITDDSLADLEEREDQSIAEIHRAIEQNPHDIAAILIETIQGEGGDNHFRGAFLNRLRQIADEQEILLIFDEVQTGLGLTGQWWAFENFKVQPDIVAYGKKAQVAGCAATKRINEVDDHVFELSSRINSTWGGNLIDMIRMERYLQIVKEENILENVRNVGQYFEAELKNLAEMNPKISNVRGKGLMIAFDLPETEMRNKVQHAIFENGALMLPCGTQSLRVRPHLDFTKDNVNSAMNIIQQALNTL